MFALVCLNLFYAFCFLGDLESLESVLLMLIHTYRNLLHRLMYFKSLNIDDYGLQLLEGQNSVSRKSRISGKCSVLETKAQCSKTLIRSQWSR